MQRCKRHNPDELSEENRKAFDEFIESKLIHQAGFAQYLKPEQEYNLYPASYKRLGHWSIIGECNLIAATNLCLHHRQKTWFPHL